MVEQEGILLPVAAPDRQDEVGDTTQTFYRAGQVAGHIFDKFEYLLTAQILLVIMVAKREGKGDVARDGRFEGPFVASLRRLVESHVAGIDHEVRLFCLQHFIHSFGGSIATAFFGAAIPEELAKLFVLWRLLRMNPYFDERMDGIVYAVCVSMGFAALENLMYVFQNSEDFLSVAVPRALFSIPGHFCFGVLMGYYFSLVRFCPAGRPRNAMLMVAAPILAHGLYDSILFVMDVSPALSGVLMLVFLFFCFKLWKLGTRKIAEHLNDDANPNNTI